MSELTPDEVRRRRLARLGTASGGGLQLSAESSSKDCYAKHTLRERERKFINQTMKHNTIYI